MTNALIQLLLASSAIVGSSVGRADEVNRLYLVVTRRAFADAVGDLVAYRRKGGYQVVTGVWEQMVPDAGAVPRAETVKAWIDATVREKGMRPAAIVLCGDETDSSDAKAAWRMPSFYKPLYRWRRNQRMTFTSDAAYGDLDGDDLPDVPVGRLSVRTGDELRAYVAKLRRYETMALRPEQLRTVLWMGIPGYDARTDAMMTPVAMTAVRRHLPRTLTAWWMSGDPTWPSWLPPDEQPKRFLSEVGAGSVFTLFSGHGSASKALANVSKTCRTAMTIEDLRHLPSERPAAPAVFLACTIGRIEWDKGPCLGEALWRHPGGPIAVVAASTQSHPLTNYYSAIALGKTMKAGHRTLGEWWVHCQRLGFREHDPLIEAMLKDAEGKLEENINVPKLRRDQPLMYILLGDPACRLRLPERLDVEVQRRDQRLTVRADLPKGVERVAVDIVVPRERSLELGTLRPTTNPSEKDRSARRQHIERFNRRRVALAAMPASAGPFEVTCTVPDKLDGDKHRARVRLAAFGDTGRIWVGVGPLPLDQEGSAR